MADLTLFISIISLVLIIWNVLLLKNKSSNSNNDSQEIISQIVLELNQTQIQSMAQILEKLNQNSLVQNREISDNLIKLEQRFGQLQFRIQEVLGEGLNKSQISIQERLERSILNLAELNKTELSKIQESNKAGLELMSRTNQERLDQINKDVQKKLDDNFIHHLKSFEDVSKNLGEMKATAQNMIDSTASIDRLNTIFSRTSSKAFGDFGEKYLESLLAENINKNSWSKQMMMPGASEKIDFVIELDGKKIGIDCKFPFTKYNDFLDAPTDQKKIMQKAFLKGVEEVAKDISQKYGKNGFIDHLLMYLPSDSMYSEVVNSPETFTTLQKLKVSPTSPVTIFPLIMLIQTYQKRQYINEHAQQIMSGLNKIKDNVKSFQEEFRKLGDKIRQAQQNYDVADKNLVSVQQNVQMLEKSDEI